MELNPIRHLVAYSIRDHLNRMILTRLHICILDLALILNKLNMSLLLKILKRLVMEEEKEAE